MTSKTVFKRYLQSTAKEIENELKILSKEWNNFIGNEVLEVKRLNKHFIAGWFGGKMLRGTLVKLGYELAENKPNSAILKASCALEILHTALIIHDDIIDQSLKRRGKYAMHIHKNSHYGISQAICLGDIGISLSGRLIADSEFSKDRKNLALNYFFEMVNTTVIGQMMDIANAQNATRTEKQILRMHTMKTANYTFVGPLTLGSILGNGSENLLIKLKLFGEPLGIAYQLQDDLLGIFGDEKKIGKSITSDTEENKSTLLITQALKHANKQQQKQLAAYYGKKNITKEQHEIIKKIFKETGSLEYSQNKIAALTAQAKTVIPEITKNKMRQALLVSLCDLLLTRNA